MDSEKSATQWADSRKVNGELFIHPFEEASDAKNEKLNFGNTITAEDSASHAGAGEQMVLAELFDVEEDELEAIPRIDTFWYHKPGKSDAVFEPNASEGPKEKRVEKLRDSDVTYFVEDTYETFNPFESQEQWKGVAKRMGIKFNQDETDEIEFEDNYQDISTQHKPSETSTKIKKKERDDLDISEEAIVEEAPAAKTVSRKRRSTLYAELKFAAARNAAYIKRDLLKIRRASTLIIESLGTKSKNIKSGILLFFGVLLIIWGIFVLLILVEVLDTAPILDMIQGKMATCPQHATKWEEWSTCSSFCSDSFRYRIRRVSFSEYPVNRELCETAESDSCQNHCNVFGLLVSEEAYDANNAESGACIVTIRSAFAKELKISVHRVILSKNSLVEYAGQPFRYLQMYISPQSVNHESSGQFGDFQALPQICEHLKDLKAVLSDSTSDIRRSISPCIADTATLLIRGFHHSNSEELRTAWEGSNSLPEEM